MVTRIHKASVEALNKGLRQPIEKVIAPEEASLLTGKSLQTLRRYARNGALVRVQGKGMKCAIGYTAASVRALVEGRAE